MKSIPYEEYFDEMELSRFQKKRRKDLAERIEQGVLVVFSFIEIMREYKAVNKVRAFDMLNQYYTEAVKEFMVVDDYLELYIKQISEDIVEETFKNEDDEYYTSEDRAVIISENEANTTINYDEFQQAILTGKTRKRWKTKPDNRVRDAHYEVSGQELNIDEPFLVGDDLMQFPKDMTYKPSASNVINCRCSIEYF